MRIGVDLGGTKIEAIAMEDDGCVVWRRRIATPAGDYEGILEAVAELVGLAETQLRQRASVGVGMPGSVSPSTGLIRNSNSTVLNGKPFDRDLAHRLDRPIRLANDANCLALSEAVDGAGATDKVVFGVILGTGVGGGLAVDKSLIVGHNRIAGEWGHNPLPWPTDPERPGPRCYCGKAGCIETFLSGAGLARDYADLTGRSLSAREVSRSADRGDPAARRCLALYQDRLARGLALVLNIVDPDVIVLGGGLSNIDTLYVGLLPALAAYAFADAIDTRVVRAAHGDSSGVRGAAWLWPVAGR
jgi:fructokinase